MAHKAKAARRHKISKARYAIKTWPDDETLLRQLGDLRIWIAGDVTGHGAVPGKRRRARPQSDLLIEFENGIAIGKGDLFQGVAVLPAEDAVDPGHAQDH